MNHEGALRASLQAEYQMRLLRGGNGRTDPPRGLLELSDLVHYLPFGSALWREYGGELALSDEGHLLREVEFALRVQDWHAGGSKGTAPVRIELPKSAEERRAEATRQNAKAEAYRRRQAAKRNG